MGMWRTDETCSAAYLLLLVLLLLRLLTGLRSADGACEPRCLHPPSPPPWIENNLRFNGSPLPGPSPLITLKTWMRYVPPRPHPYRLNKPAGFWFSSCCDSSSPPFSPAPCVRFTPPRLYLTTIFYLFIYFFALLFPDLNLVYLPLQMCHLRSKTPQHGALSAGRRGSQRQQSSRSAAGPSRYSAG